MGRTGPPRAAGPATAPGPGPGSGCWTGLLVPPGQPRLMAEAVRFLLDSPQAAARMAAAAQARMGERFGEPALRSALAPAYDGGVPQPRLAWLTMNMAECDWRIPNSDRSRSERV